MAKAPWTDPDPQPGDFDAELDGVRSDQIEIHEGNPDTKLSVLVRIAGDDVILLPHRFKRTFRGSGS